MAYTKANGLKSTVAEKQNSFIKWMNWYLRLAAIRSTWPWLDRPRIVYYCLVMAALATCGWTMFYNKYDDLTVNTDTLLHAVCTGHTLFLYLVYMWNRRKLCGIADAMQNRFSQFSDRLPLDKYRHIWERADRMSMVLVRFGSHLCIAVYVLFIFNANIFSSNRKTLYPIWVPYSMHPNFNYFITILLQLSIFSLYSFIHVSGHGLGIGGAHFIGASFDVLGSVFKELCDWKMEVNSLSNALLKKAMIAKYDVVVKQKLKWWVEAHLAVLKIANDYKSVYEAIHVEVLLSCVVLICFGGFQIILAIERGDYKRVAMLSCLIFLLTFHLFLFCYPGQHIYNKSEKLRQTLYLSRWQDQNLSFCKSVCIMLVCTLKPVRLSYRGFVDASMPSFIHAIWSAFQYVNILLILRSVH